MAQMQSTSRDSATDGATELSVTGMTPIAGVKRIADRGRRAMTSPFADVGGARTSQHGLWQGRREWPEGEKQETSNEQRAA